MTRYLLVILGYNFLKCKNNTTLTNIIKMQIRTCIKKREKDKCLYIKNKRRKKVKIKIANKWQC